AGPGTERAVEEAPARIAGRARLERGEGGLHRLEGDDAARVAGLAQHGAVLALVRTHVQHAVDAELREELLQVGVECRLVLAYVQEFPSEQARGLFVQLHT